MYYKEEFLADFLDHYQKLSLMKNVLDPLAKNVLIPLGLTAAIIISNEQMNYIMKIVKSLEESISLIKGVSETIRNKAKEQKRGISQYVIRYIRC